MTIPSQHQAWVKALRLERPWEDNETTRGLAKRINDEDLSATIWALERTNGLKWLDLKLAALGDESPASLLSTDHGRLKIWATLEAATAWL